jgi:hypothetical protein
MAVIEEACEPLSQQMRLLPPGESINPIVDRLTKMVHFLPCSKTMTAEGLADLMIKNVWKLHGKLKTIVLDRGSIFNVSCITQELNQRLGVQLVTSTAYHPRTNGQSKIETRLLKST